MVFAFHGKCMIKRISMRITIKCLYTQCLFLQEVQMCEEEDARMLYKEHL
jgi:hypothetical protein